MNSRSTRIVTIDPAAPDPETLRTAAAVIRAGGLVAFPTETVYGLGANALDESAVAGIFQAKGRPARNPLIVHIADRSMLDAVAASWPAIASTLAVRFWPGSLTLVVPKAASIPLAVTAGGSTVAIRMPAHPVALGLIRAAGLPLAAPSANRSTEISPTRAEHVRSSLDGRIDLILDGGPTVNGIESTVLDLTTDPPTLLRPGPISVAQLEDAIGPIRRRPMSDSVSGPLPSPGLMPRHYAPRTPVELHSSRTGLDVRRSELMQQGESHGAVVIGSGGADSVVVMPADAASYAARIYAVLHEMDSRNLARILIEMPPDTEEWLAVRDRLTRAATR